MAFLTINNCKICQALGSDYTTASANIYEEINIKKFPIACVLEDDEYTRLTELYEGHLSHVYNVREELFTSIYWDLKSINPDLFNIFYYGLYTVENEYLPYTLKVFPNYVHFFDHVTGSTNNQLIKVGDYEIFCGAPFVYTVGSTEGYWYKNGQLINRPIWVSSRVDTYKDAIERPHANLRFTVCNKSLTQASSLEFRSGASSDYIDIAVRNAYINKTQLLSIGEEINIEVGDLPTDPYEQGGGEESDTGGGGGSWDDTSDPIDYTPKPNFNVVNTGFIKLYNPDITMIKALADYMWNPVTWDPSTWQNLFADPMDAILGLNLLPVTVPNGATTLVTVGNMQTSVGMPPVTEQFVDVDCGEIDITEYWGSYLDYAPYTKAQLYLPYCGIHEISADEIMGKTLGVHYVVDVLSGACRAEVKCGESVLYQFIGQCAASIPTSGRDWGTMINGVITAAVSVGSMVATGGMAAPLAAGNLASAAVNIIKPSIEKSGAMSGPGGLLCRPVPYLILTLPVQCVPGNQNKYVGYPSYITRNLGGLSGYTEIDSIHLHGIPGTEEEINEIERLLKEGVIL